MGHKNIVIIGGGSGLSQFLRGLKYLDNVSISAIVTVADDGGSTGKLRDAFHLPAMGDIRRVICSLSENRPQLEKLMDYRFEGEGEVGNHSLGNLIITAMADLEGSFTKGVEAVSDVLNINGRVIPASDEYLELVAEYEDGTTCIGESRIPNANKSIKKVYYEGNIKASSDAVLAINDADVIIFSFGSLYTSVLATAAIPALNHALTHNKHGKKYYFANLMTQPGETDNMSVSDHVKAIEDHLDTPNYFDKVFISEAPDDKSLIKKYADANQHILEDDSKGKGFKTQTIDVVSKNQVKLIRHSEKKITKELKKIIR